MQITEALEILVPTALDGGYPRDEATYNSLRWDDPRSKPPWTSIIPLMAQPSPRPSRTDPELSNSELVDLLIDEGLVTRGQVNAKKNASAP